MSNIKYVADKRKIYPRALAATHVLRPLLDGVKPRGYYNILSMPCTDWAWERQTLSLIDPDLRKRIRFIGVEKDPALHAEIMSDRGRWPRKWDEVYDDPIDVFDLFTRLVPGPDNERHHAAFLDLCGQVNFDGLDGLRAMGKNWLTRARVTPIALTTSGRLGDTYRWRKHLEQFGDPREAGYAPLTAQAAIAAIEGGGEGRLSGEVSDIYSYQAGTGAPMILILLNIFRTALTEGERGELDIVL
jgi:hypothetical protein